MARVARIVADVPALPGSYALVFECRGSRCVSVGALGNVQLRPGYYVYVGSAFGPGGLRARVSRHARMRKKRHWHIDYLRPYLALRDVWWTTDSDNREHDWATRLATAGEAAHPRFGASDCRCRTHLLRSERPPQATVVRARGRYGA